MARPRGQGRVGATRKKGERQERSGGLNSAYQDMLAEAGAESSPTQTGDEGRPIKRRRVRGKIVSRDATSSDQSDPFTTLQRASNVQPVSGQWRGSSPSDDEAQNRISGIAVSPLRQEQIAYEDETADESDFAWEQVDLAQEADQPVLDSVDEEREQDLDLVLENNGEQGFHKTAAPRRKVLTAEEKKQRLDVHKVHILCLLSHFHLRNHWCNDQNVHVRNQPTIPFYRRLRIFPRKQYTVDCRDTSFPS